MKGEIEEPLIKVMEKVWEEKSIPEGWKKEVIYPTFKKGDGEEVKNYRGVTLMDTSYKIYASILNKKLKGEINMKRHSSDSGRGDEQTMPYIC